MKTRKKVCTFFAAMIMTIGVFAQSPERMSYQAVIRNNSNALVVNHQLAMRISILQGSATGTAVYVETQQPTTNANGLVSIEIGGGTLVSGSFSSIDWANGPYFVKTETDLNGGGDYAIVGTSQLLSVPYALHAKTAENITGGITETDPAFNASASATITGTDINNWNNKLNVEVDSSVTNELQVLSISNDTIRLTNGGFVKLPSGFSGDYNDLTNKPSIPVVPTNVGAFTNDAGYITSFTEVDGSVTNELQVLSISNDTIRLTNGGFVKLPSGFSGNYNDLTNKPTIPVVPTNVGAFTNDAGYITSFTEVDGSVTNELQALSISNDTIYLSNGGFVKLPLSSEGDPIFGAWDKTTGISITKSQVSDFGNYLETETDPVYLNSAASGISNSDTQFWNNKQNKLTAGTGIAISGDTIKVVGGVNPGSTLPTVNTINFSSLSYRNVVVSGDVTNSGNEMVVVRGFCYGTNPSPTFANSFVQSGNGQGTFNAALDSLTPGTTYYFRAFATNIVGTAYGNEEIFTTRPMQMPVLTTSTIENISFTTAQSGGDISDQGGTPITGKGICWSTSSNPTIADSHTTENTTFNPFVSLLSGLTPATTYYVRAYAANAIGTAYGNEVSFMSNTLSLATITTSAVTNVSFSSATGGGTVVSDNGSPVTTRGVCWAATANPTTDDNSISQSAGLGAFTLQISGLNPNITYYVRAYAVNVAGTVYGDQVSFTTPTLTAPVLTTKAISGISSNIATSGGDVISDGGSAITAKGVCWSVNPMPTILDNKTNQGAGSSSYNSNMTGLAPLTKYYVRAYATNAVGTTYGNEINFTSTDLIMPPGTSNPIVATAFSVLTNSSTASSGGYVSSEGGSPIIARGVCWGTSANPTLAANHTQDSAGTGYFNSTITGLTGCNTTHYIRAYAYNSTDTAYGAQNTVVTGGLPTGVTTIIDETLPYSITAGGNIPDDGGCSITERGICWNLTGNPTTSTNKITSGTGSGTFSAIISNLMPNVTVYIKSYAVNSKGIVYGNEQAVTTAIPSTLYLGQSYAGGKIFYLDETGEHGFVCTPSSIGSFQWGCAGTNIATSADIGTGEMNTIAMLAFCAETNTAAYACDTLVLNGYSDWYLPSINELKMVYNNIGKWGVVPNLLYWSSTECSATHAKTSSTGGEQCGGSYRCGFSTCYYGKPTSYDVIAIRRF